MPRSPRATSRTSPRTDAGVAVQAVTVTLLAAIGLVLTWRNRDLRLFVGGLAMITYALPAMVPGRREQGSSLGYWAFWMQVGGMFGMTFWGSPKRVGLLPYFVTIAMNSPQSHVEATLGQGNTGRPGVAEALVESAGLRVVERGAVQVTAEFPDLDTFLRAAVAAGPSFPAIEQVGEPKCREALGLAYADAVVPGIGMRIVSELGWLSAAK